ncbi:hypothetical protein H4696_000845 [Amycolatopsis lexingtonensis]|uniref:Uncharacterized protein n=1 Tax=Amycolatopsis lexingtonensis TaxID=218822 RepID=A0ABR9HS48_9PSEU|nr:hypothetical protein [Amycolatopsis lexingtonensis]
MPTPASLPAEPASPRRAVVAGADRHGAAYREHDWRSP